MSYCIQSQGIHLTDHWLLDFTTGIMYSFTSTNGLSLLILTTFINIVHSTWFKLGNSILLTWFKRWSVEDFVWLNSNSQTCGEHTSHLGHYVLRATRINVAWWKSCPGPQNDQISNFSYISTTFTLLPLLTTYLCQLPVLLYIEEIPWATHKFSWPIKYSSNTIVVE